MSGQTVLDSMIRDCRKAMLHGKPLLFLRTNEIGLVRQIVESDRLVVRLSRNTDRGADSPVIFPTREAKEKADGTLLFRQPGKSDGTDLNIICVDGDANKKAFIFSEKDYGKSCLASPFRYPCLYLIHYQQDAKSHFPADLRSFIDRYLMESAHMTDITGSVVLIYGDFDDIPGEYADYCEIIDEPYPEIGEIASCLREYECCRGEARAAAVNTLANALQGLPVMQVKRLVRSLANTPDSRIRGGVVLEDEVAARKEIQEYKSQILKKSDLLQLIITEKRTGEDEEQGDHFELGGMKRFREWVAGQADSIREASGLRQGVGIDPPKGILLCGIPGSGKSEAAKAVANTLRLPLLKLDVGQLMGKYVGESEHNMTKALRTAEAMAPCVLFIDELDKGFSGAGSGNNDAGPFRRMFGTLLGWMQDCKEPCFIFATANDISQLPKEFFRSGRFDCLYSLYMPAARECAEIFQVRMRMAERAAGRKQLFDSECYDADSLRRLLDECGEKGRFVTGADITKLVSMALRVLWQEGKATPVIWRDWRKMLLRALDETTVYGDSKENRDSIALCYIRLMRSNFRPASDDVLFSGYTVKRKEREDGAGIPEYEVTLTDGEGETGKYDAALKNMLRPLIEQYGPMVEQEALRRMI